MGIERIFMLINQFENSVNQAFSAAESYNRNSSRGLLSYIGNQFDGSYDRKKKISQRMVDVTAFNVGSFQGFFDQIEEEFEMNGIDGQAIRNQLGKRFQQIMGSRTGDRARVMKAAGYCVSYLKAEASKLLPSGFNNNF